jgi:hypothetical protein
MKRIATYLATAAFGSALLTVGGAAAWAQVAAPGQMSNYCTTPTKTCMLSHGSVIGSGCSCRVPGGRERGTVASGYGYPSSAYGTPSGGLGEAFTAPFAAAAAAPSAVAGAATAPFMAGRSVAAGQIGNSCTTPQKTCALRNPSYVGTGCSCRVSGGRASGSVTP